MTATGHQNDGAEEKQPQKNPKPPEISRTKPNQKPQKKTKKNKEQKKIAKTRGFWTAFKRKPAKKQKTQKISHANGKVKKKKSR